MKKIILLIPLLVAAFFISCDKKNESKYIYETVENDPLNTRIYTLDNGLKVYLSVNKDKPRIQTYIGVRVGGKNDPAETTGLAHYFEHLMFKGTVKFGTSDYENEKPLLDEIERLYEVYRQTTGEEARKSIYARIDSISQEASKYAIPNEYDKLMSAIGSQGTNAFTSYDQTAYIENIPSNEIENWAMIQAERFKEPVIRLFHTELETVYEEYNMSLTRDWWRMNDTLMSALFPHHPYGKQTILGTQEHLKNPSITNIKKYFDTYYVPNNMAICMAGDLDPDETIKIIDKYFSWMKPKKTPELKISEETPITKPVVKEVTGLEAARLSIGYRMPAANTKDAAILELVDYMLTNGKAGLIDLNLVKKQKVLEGGSYSRPLADYSLFVMYGTPKAGQTLDEVRDLLLGQLEELKKGEFDDSLLEAVINNFRLSQYYQQQEIDYAAYVLLNAFANNIPWKDVVNKIDFQSSLTKQDIVDFCNKYFNNNYAVVYKTEGKPNDKKIEKPQITPITANRDQESAFLAKIKKRPVNPIEPLFLDFDKDLSQFKVKNNITTLYKQNTTNPLFVMQYVYEMGNDNDKAFSTAFDYLKYLGASIQTAEQIESELYKLASSIDFITKENRICVYISGLNENFEKTVELIEGRLNDPKIDTEAYNNFVVDILKKRSNEKLNQYSNFNALKNYAKWGVQSSLTNILSETELNNMNPEELTSRTKSLKNYDHRILYYGPLSEKEFTKIMNRKHVVAENLEPIPVAKNFTEQPITENSVLLANYDAKQIYMSMLYKGGGFDKEIEPVSKLYNEYFGGGMNSIVFQEMREARGLAYSAWAGYESPDKPDRSYYMNTFIASQTDKTKEAIDAFVEILNNMPESEKAFEIAKESMITNIRTDRVLRDDILWNYVKAQEFGYINDPRIKLFEEVQKMTLEDVKKFQESYVKNKPYIYCILGDLNELDKNSLVKYGKVKVLTQKEIFGY